MGKAHIPTLRKRAELNAVSFKTVVWERISVINIYQMIVESCSCSCCVYVCPSVCLTRLSCQLFWHSNSFQVFGMCGCTSTTFQWHQHGWPFDPDPGIHVTKVNFFLPVETEMGKSPDDNKLRGCEGYALFWFQRLNWGSFLLSKCLHAVMDKKVWAASV